MSDLPERPTDVHAPQERVETNEDRRAELQRRYRLAWALRRYKWPTSTLAEVEAVLLEAMRK